MTKDFTPHQLSAEEQKEFANALAVVQRLGAYTVMEKDRETEEWRVVRGLSTVKGRDAARKELERYKKTFKRNSPDLQVVPKNLADAIRYNIKVVKQQLKLAERYDTNRLPSGMYLPDNL